MSEIFDGTVEIQDGSGNTTVLADGNTGYLGVGGGGQDGAFHVHDAAGASRVMFGGGGTIILSNSSAVSLVTIANDGQIYIQRTLGAETYPVLQFLSPQAALSIGGEITPGTINVRNGDGDDVVVVEGDGATIFVGAENNEGEVIVRDDGGRDAIHLDGNTAAIFVGTEGAEGDVIVRDDSGRKAIHLDGNTAGVFVGAEGAEGDVIVRDGEGRTVVHLGGEKAVVDVGTAGNEGDVRVFDGNGTLRIHLDGASGQVLTFGADCAEDFEVADAAAIEPGAVLVIDDTGNLRESCGAYDHRVAGVVSGGGSLGPGMVLGRKPDATESKPVALIGKVYCKVDADPGAIAVGDMLTTADRPGHAMKASDPQRAFGAVIGKALAPLKAGRGMIPILVTLR